VYRILEGGGGESKGGNRSDGQRAEWAITLHRILNILDGKKYSGYMQLTKGTSGRLWYTWHEPSCCIKFMLFIG
jgi:hypothetical protein